MDEDRERDRRVVVARARRAVGLLRARDAFDDRVDGLEVARVRGQQDADVAGIRVAPPNGTEVVLDVAGRSLLGDDGLDRALAFELAEDFLVGASDDVREHVQASAMGHSDDDLVRSRLHAELDRLVEHGHHHVETFDRELLLAEELALQVMLEAFDVGQPLEQPPDLVPVERLAVAARLDRMPQPDALLVVGDVLDLVCDRPAVDLAELRQHVRQGLALDSHSEHRRGNRLLQLRSELRDEQVRLERRVSDGLGAERVEVRGQMTVSPVGLDQRHRGGNASEQSLVRRGRGCLRRGRLLLRRLRRCQGRLRLDRDRFGRLSGRRSAVSVLQVLEQAGEPRQRLEQAGVTTLEERSPLLRDRFGILEVLLEQSLGIARVDSVDIAHAHQVRSSTRSPCGGA